MAKVKQNNPGNKTPVAGAGSAGSFTSSPLFRNGIIILLFSIVFLGVYKMNDHDDERRNLETELDVIEQTPGSNDVRKNEIERRLHEISVDTGYVKALFLGYYADVRYVALGVQKQIDHADEEIKAQKAKFHIDNGGEITREDKLRVKVKTYLLLERINQYCPANSVILLPPADSLANDEDWNFVYDPMWVEYFIYPRLCIASGTEAQYPDLAKRITHVLIVKGIGYDKLKYKVPPEKRERLGLLPVNEPLDSNQIAN